LDSSLISDPYPRCVIRLTAKVSSGTLAGMQLLGISDKKERDDGRLKSIFWPTVENQWDVDHLCRQGFWICTIIAAVQLILSFFREPG